MKEIVRFTIAPLATVREWEILYMQWHFLIRTIFWLVYVLLLLMAAVISLCWSFFFNSSFWRKYIVLFSFLGDAAIMFIGKNTNSRFVQTMQRPPLLKLQQKRTWLIALSRQPSGGLLCKLREPVSIVYLGSFISDVHPLFTMFCCC